MSQHDDQEDEIDDRKNDSHPLNVRHGFTL